jgi:hypothetical protein
MTYRRRVVATAATLVLAGGLLAACVDGTVRKRDCDGQGQNQVCRLLVVDKNKRERWVEVDQFAFQNCRIGASYPACGSTGYDNPEARRDVGKDKQDKRRSGQGPDVDPQPNPGFKDSRRDEQNKQGRDVCVSAVMTPRRLVKIDWNLDSTEGEDGRYGEFGPRCRRVQPGKNVWIQVVEDNDVKGRKTSLCTLFIIAPGGRKIIDYMMRSDGGVCIAQGKVPG